MRFLPKTQTEVSNVQQRLKLNVAILCQFSSPQKRLCAVSGASMLSARALGDRVTKSPSHRGVWFMVEAEPQP